MPTSAERKHATHAPLTLSIQPVSGGWTVITHGQGVSGGRYSTQREAVAAARSAVSARGGLVVVHARNGRVKETVTLGSQAMTRLNAIEGVRLGAKTREILRRSEREGVSAAERRRVVLRAFMKSPI